MSSPPRRTETISAGQVGPWLLKVEVGIESSGLGRVSSSRSKTHYNPRIVLVVDAETTQQERGSRTSSSCQELSNLHVDDREG